MTTTTRTQVALPTVASVYRTRASVELKEFFRQREAVVFTLLFPVILLLVFGAVLNYDICLLYTSPSPRDGLLSRMPSSA